MRKTWIHKRPKPKGKGYYYYVKWMDEVGKERSKLLPNAAMARHYSQIKYQQLNSDVFTDSISIEWQIAKDEFKQSKITRGLTRSSIHDSLLTLKHLEEYMPVQSTKQISQELIDGYIRHRLEKVARYTVNKDIGNLKAFINWLKSKNYHKGNIRLQKLKTTKPTIRIPDDDKIRQLVRACPSSEWRLRVLMALCTGLRKNDLYRLPAGSIDLKKGWLHTIETKTQKEYSTPLPDKLVDIIREHQTNGDYFFNVRNSQWLDKQWRNFRPFEITIQDLRKINKTLLQKIGNLSSITDLIGHSDYRITEQFYTDSELIHRWKINQLPIDRWL